MSTSQKANEKERYLVGEYLNNPMFDTVDAQGKRPTYQNDETGSGKTNRPKNDS